MGICPNIPDVIMKTTTFLPVFSIICAAASIGSAGAKEKEYRLSEWTIGKVLFGERVSKAVTKDKVVVIENWGTHCPPCIASLPHLAQLEKDNRAKGLVVIGAESQGSSKDEIKPLIEKAKVEYTITDGAEGPIEVTGIPRAFVFDRQGKLAFDGSPLDKAFTEAVTKALGDGAPATTPAATAGTTPAPAATATTPLIASRAWTNADGKEIHAAVKSVDANNVVFLMDGGKEVTYPLSKLSEESRNAITLLAK